MPSSLRPDWDLVPTVLLRHAGYPVEDLDGVRFPGLLDRYDELVVAWRDAAAKAGALKDFLRARGVRAPGVSPGIGMLKPLDEAALPGLGSAVVPAEYRSAVGRLDDLLRACEEAHAEAMSASRAHLVRLFGDPWRQQTLLLSNTSVFTDFRNWLPSADRPHDAHARKMTDLLAMYLQRITTKNETNSHFGPFGVGRALPGESGLRWSLGEDVERAAFLSHWASSALARGFEQDRLRPRPVPLAFRDGNRVSRYAFEDRPGLPYPWHLVLVRAHDLDEEHRSLLDLADGARTVAELRSEWTVRWPVARFRSALDGLADMGLLHLGPELPVGETFPEGLRRLYLEHGADLAPVDRLDDLLTKFAGAAPDLRADVLAEINDFFQQTTGEATARSGGRHYADRAVLYEDAVSQVRDVVVGQEIHDFVTSDLAGVYDALLLGSRVRMARERVLLREWLRSSFGTGVEVPLGQVYERFLADRDAVGELCDEVDAEVAAAEDHLVGELLSHWDGESPEVDVAPGVLHGVLARYPAGPAAVCNPDVMLGATDPSCFATGDFFGVIGDAHAVRDLLTHGPFTPFLTDRAPGLTDEILAGYRRIVDEDEVLVDIVRSHTSKISVQARLPLPDLEIVGRSMKDRADVLRPEDLSLVAHEDRVELRSGAVPGRIRLLASLSGAGTIRHDPVAVFSFPRSLGGGVLADLDREHLPRFRSGRVVFTRRRWRVRCDSVDAALPRKWQTGDARSFLAARLLTERHDLPRHVFVKFAHEPKPIYVDWSSPILVRQFFRQLRGAAPGDSFDVSEMLPSPEHLWLRIGENHHTAEIRCAVFSRP
ncbi:lantibiotic dehydratase [Lentzea sp. JNUCC 0626]|uniref:lantibiotic dehydratase n=1 Tax=Lentzea sp. JNUCC 0626 TaxID=3367513 RepID=UPI0037479199